MARALRSTAVPESLSGRACSVRKHDVFPTQPTTNKQEGQTERHTDRQTDRDVNNQTIQYKSVSTKRG